MGLFSSIKSWFGDHGSAVGAGLSSAANLVGGIANSALSYKYSKKLMEAQQEWQEKMSNTSHQREVADLKAAGLNPILSSNSGSTWGSASSMSANVDTGIQDVVSSAMEYRQAKKNLELTEEQRMKTIKENANLSHENNLLQEELYRSIMDTEAHQRLLDLDIRQKQAQNDLISAQAVAQLSENPYIARKNSAMIEQIKSQTSANSAAAYYNRHRSLGFSESESKSYSGKVGPAGGSYSHSKSRTH